MRIKRKIIAANLVTGHVTKHDSIYKASKSLKINPGSIRLIAEGKRKTAKPENKNQSYTFEFADKNDLINSSNWQCFSHKCFMSVPHRKHTMGNGQNSGGGEALKSRYKGTRREALLGGDKIEWYRG